MRRGEIAEGMWWWTARHPDAQPDQSWDPVVRCFCVAAPDATVIVDPLLPADEPDRLWVALDAEVQRRDAPVAVVLTEAAHARDSGPVARRYGTDVWGHELAAAKVDATFHVVSAGDDVPGGRVLAFDHEPRGTSTPLYFPTHKAIAVGDVFISRDDGLRVWWGHGASDESWFDQRLVPSLRRWLELPLEHLLVSHGPLVAACELAAALERPPDRGK